MPETLKVPVKEKIGYAMGDIATNFFFQSMILYQTRFYTDTAGLSATSTRTRDSAIRGVFHLARRCQAFALLGSRPSRRRAIIKDQPGRYP